MTLEPHSARLMPSVVAPPTIAFHPEGQETPGDLRALPCPNCGGTADKVLVLTVDVQLPDNPAKRLRVLRCPGCTANFYDSQVPPDYAEPALNNRGRVPFYVQQGAGVSLITRPLAQLRREPGTSYMEVGCGYGFGLDFALNTRGWTGLGIDPAPLAALGRDALQLPIELRYLRDDDEARGTIDVVLGSEVIEHVPSPSAFVRTLRAMLEPDGVLVLTTPNGDDIDPATPPGIIIPLLSPSLHLVIQNRVSLRALLEQAGFAHVAVEIDSHSLVAFASDVPLALEEDHGTLRRALRDHLEHRARTVDPSTDLFLAFAGRAFYESVNDGDMAAADRAWALLVPAIQDRFGLQVDSLSALPDAVATCSLEEMARLVPLNLGGMLYARAIQRLAGGTPRAVLEPTFLLSAEAAAAMRRALGELAMEDGQTEDIGWTSTAEAILSAGDAGAPALAARLQALPPAPNGGERRRLSIALRSMTTLVNAGHLATGRALVRALGLDEAAFAQDGAARSEAERDALFCLAILDAEIGEDGRALGDPEAARRRFEAVRLESEPGSGLWWSALRGTVQAMGLTGDTAGAAALVAAVDRDTPAVDTAGWALSNLVNLGQYETARGIALRSGLAQAEFADPAGTRTLTPEQCGVVFALAMLDAELGPDQQPVGNLVLAQGRFRRLRQATAPGSGLWWSALRGEVQTMGLMGDKAGVAALVAAVDRDTPAVDTAGWALSSLVNLGQYETARGIALRSGLAQAEFADPAGTRTLTPEQCGVVFALAVLDAELGPDQQPVGNLALARGRFRRLRQATAPGGGLWWSALRGEAQTIGQMQDTAGLLALVEAMRAEHAGIDTAAWAVPNLVQAGQLDAAQAVADASGLAGLAYARGDAAGGLTEEQRAVVLSLATLDSRVDAAQAPIGDLMLARARFRRVRLDAAPGGPDWWAALRGEAHAMGVAGDREGIGALAEMVAQEHPGVDSARWALPSLVNSGHYASGRAVAERSGLKTAAFTQPGSTRSLSAEERDLVFYLAVLDAEIGPHGRAVGEPAMARGRFARVRRASTEGSGLWLAALRGELQALDLLDAHEEAAALTRDVMAGYPHLTLPPDVLVRIGRD